jgi:hypothetical protein
MSITKERGIGNQQQGSTERSWAGNALSLRLRTHWGTQLRVGSVLALDRRSSRSGCKNIDVEEEVEKLALTTAQQQSRD